VLVTIHWRLSRTEWELITFGLFLSRTKRELVRFQPYLSETKIRLSKTNVKHNTPKVHTARGLPAAGREVETG